MKILALCLLLTLASTELSDDSVLENEMELLERLAGGDRIKHLLSYKETKKAREHVRRLEETTEAQDDDDDNENKYIKLDSGVRELTNMSCNRDYLQLFTLIGRKINYAYVTKIQDHEYCFTDFSCCTTEHFSHMIHTFSMNINRIRRRFKPLIELLTFFRGPELRRFVKANRNNPRCKYYIYDNRKNGVNLFDEEVLKQYSTLVVSFISQIKNFVDKKEEFFGNILCSICSPKQQTYISFNTEDNKMEFEFSSDICNSVYADASFEMKVQYIYKYLVRRIADFVECASDLTLEGYATARTIIYPKQQFHLNKECYNNFNTDMPRCLDFCRTDLDLFKFDQYSQLTRHIRQTLRLFYRVFTGGAEEVEEHYKKTSGYNFHMGMEVDPIVIFSEKSPIALKYNIANDYTIVFSERGGLNPFMTPISTAFWAEVDHIILHSGKA